MVIEVRLVQPRNVRAEISKSDSDSLTYSRLVHPQNADPPKVVTESGMTIDCKLIHLMKAPYQ